MAEPPAAVGLVGGGVIGGGWAARYLLAGHPVRIYDPAPAAEARLREMLDGARRALRRLTLAPLPAEGTLTVCERLEDAVAAVAVVHESAPERLELKQRLLGAVSRAADPATLLFSSTSGLLPSALESDVDGPERFAVAHPFNPVYLLPLVELCGGTRTAPETLEHASEWFAAVGMHPLTVTAEIDGFLADRLLEAMWREALWLVHDGVASTEEVDDALRYGAGLRMAIMGPYLTYRIAGGERGMRHFMAQFGPALKWPWTKLTDVPELTDDFLDRLDEQSDTQAGHRTVGELERVRDDCLVALLQGLRGQGEGAGATLATWEQQLMRRAAHDAADVGTAEADAPLTLVSRLVPAEWIDYNGHVHESRYLQLTADATDALLARLGVDDAYLSTSGSYFTVESHIRHLGQLRAGERARVTTQVLGADAKRLHVFHRVVDDGGQEVASAEQMLLHVDADTGRAGPAQGTVRERALALAQAHAAAPVPPSAGRHIGALDR